MAGLPFNISLNPLDLITTPFNLANAVNDRKLKQQQLQYEKEMGQLQMQREDTAMQRRVADLEAAGLHKTLAAGGAGAASQPIHVSQPNPPNPVNSGNSHFDVLSGKQIELMDAQIKATNAQANNLNSQSRNTDYRTDIDLPADLAIRQSEAERRVESHPYNLSILKQEAENILPQRYNRMLLDYLGEQLQQRLGNQSLRHRDSQETRNRYNHVSQAIASRLDQTHRELQNSALELQNELSSINISRETLQNQLNAHVVEMGLDRLSNPNDTTSPAAHIDNFLNGMGITLQNTPTIYRIARSLLIAGNRVSDLVHRHDLDDR